MALCMHSIQVHMIRFPHQSTSEMYTFEQHEFQGHTFDKLCQNQFQQLVLFTLSHAVHKMVKLFDYFKCVMWSIFCTGAQSKKSMLIFSTGGSTWRFLADCGPAGVRRNEKENRGTYTACLKKLTLFTFASHASQTFCSSSVYVSLYSRAFIPHWKKLQKKTWVNKVPLRKNDIWVVKAQLQTRNSLWIPSSIVAVD